MSPNAPAPRRPEARPDEILAAAVVVFEAAGFDAARMDDVAAKAGLSKAGVYLYFESKEALLRALIERHIAPIAERATHLAELGKADPEGALRMIIAMAASRLAQPGLFAIPRLVISISARFPDIATLYRDRVVGPVWLALTGLIEAGIRQGRFAPVDAGCAARALMGPMIMEAIRRHALGDLDAADWESWPLAQLEFVLRAMKPEAQP
jgi:AcrR family transcriptional regulator